MQAGVEDVEPALTDWGTLEVELLTKVASHLVGAADKAAMCLTCKGWRRAVHTTVTQVPRGMPLFSACTRFIARLQGPLLASLGRKERADPSRILAGDPASPPHVADLCQRFPNLTHFFAGHNSGLTRRAYTCVELLLPFKQLSSLEIDMLWPFGTHLLAALPRLPGITRLELLSSMDVQWSRGAPLRKADIKAVCRSVNAPLTTLSAHAFACTRGCPVPCSLVMHYLADSCRLTGLVSLSLTCHDALLDEDMDEDLRSLGKLQRLRELRIQGRSPLRGDHFGEFLPTGLTHLDLSGSGLGDRFLCALGPLTDLEILSVADCHNTTGSFLPLLGCRGLRRLDLSGCLFDPDHCEELCSFPQLSWLSLSHCTNMTDEALSQLSTHTAMRDLNLSACSLLKYRGLVCLMSMYHLTRLDLSGTTAGVKQELYIQDLPSLPKYFNLDLLQWLPELKSLNLSDCRHLVAESLGDLLLVTQLEELNLAHTSRSIAASIAVIGELRQLTLLDLHGNIWLPYNLLEAISELQSLAVLDISYTDMDESCLTALHSLTALQKLALARSAWLSDAGLGHLQGVFGLSELNLSDCRKVSLSAILGLVNSEKLRLAKLWLVNCGLNVQLSADETIETAICLKDYQKPIEGPMGICRVVL